MNLGEQLENTRRAGEEGGGGKGFLCGRVWKCARGLTQGDLVGVSLPEPLHEIGLEPVIRQFVVISMFPASTIVVGYLVLTGQTNGT